MPTLPSLASCLGTLALLLALSQRAAAQTAPAADKEYTYVEKMPQLPGGGGAAGIVAAIQQRLVYPLSALRDHVEGKVFVKFLVGPDGAVRRVKIVKGVRRDLNAAVVQAVRQLPRFEPGLQDGRPVTVSFTAPITFDIQ